MDYKAPFLLKESASYRTILCQFYYKDPCRKLLKVLVTLVLKYFLSIHIKYDKESLPTVMFMIEESMKKVTDKVSSMTKIRSTENLQKCLYMSTRKVTILCEENQNDSNKQILSGSY